MIKENTIFGLSRSFYDMELFVCLFWLANDKNPTNSYSYCSIFLASLSSNSLTLSLHTLS